MSVPAAPKVRNAPGERASDDTDRRQYASQKRKDDRAVSLDRDVILEGKDGCGTNGVTTSTAASGLNLFAR